MIGNDYSDRAGGILHGDVSLRHSHFNIDSWRDARWCDDRHLILFRPRMGAIARFTGHISISIIIFHQFIHFSWNE